MFSVVFGAAILAAAFFLYIFNSPETLKKEIAPSIPSFVLAESQNPVAGLSVDISRLIELLENHSILTEGMEASVKKLIELQSLGLDIFDIFIFPDKDHNALPVIALRGSRDFVFKHLLSDALFGPYLEKITEDEYRFDTAALPAEDWVDFPVDIYRLRLIDGSCFIAPESLLHSVPPGFDVITQSPVAQFGRTVKEANGVGVLAIRFPVDFTAGWQEKLDTEPLLQEIPVAKQLADTVITLCRQLVEPFTQLQYMAIGLRSDGEHRYLRFAQLFQPDVNGAAIYEKLQIKEADPDPGPIGNILAVLADPRLTAALDYQENLLEYNISWKTGDDQSVLSAFAQATIGYVLDRSLLSGEPSEGRITPSYISMPELTPQVDQQQLESSLPQLVGMNLFPWSYWDMGEKPDMDLELDPLAFPNADLAVAEYNVLKISSAEGKDVHRHTDVSSDSILHFASGQTEHLRLNVLAGTPAEELRTAILRFKISVPTDLQVFRFKTDGQKKTQKKDAIQIVASRIERDIAEIHSQGGEGIWLFAFDKTGKTLAKQESLSTSSGVFQRFAGEIDDLQVVVAGNILEQTFDVEIDLNGGKKLELSRMPEAPTRTRLDHSPAQNFVAVSAEQLAGLEVKWFEDDASKWSTQGLKIALPDGPTSIRTKWETYFFGEARELTIPGTPYSSVKDFGYWVDPGKLKDVHAAFGKVHVTAAGTMKKLQFENPGNRTFLTERLNQGEEIAIAFNKNQIAYRTTRAEIIQLHAYDAQNRRLKMENYFSQEQGTTFRYFWGMPTRVELVTATDFHARTIDFDVRPRSIETQTYEEFQKEIARRNDLANNRQHN